MTKRRYYFKEGGENCALRSLVQKAKACLQNNEDVIKVYQKYTRVLYGQSPKNVLDLVRHNTQSIVLNRPRVPKQSRVSTSPETINEASSTPLKKISTMRRKHLPFDNVDDEALQNVTTSQEGQPSPLKTTLNTTESDSVPQEDLPLTAADKVASPIVSRNRRKQLSPVKIDQNVNDPENFPDKSLSVCHTAMDKATPVNLKFHIPATIQTLVVSPKKADREITKGERKYLKTTSQECETTRDSEEKRKPETSDEAVGMSSVLTEKIKESLNTQEKVGANIVSSIDDGKNIGHEKNATALDNQKSSDLAQKTEIIQISDSEKNYFTPGKKTKISVNPVKNTQDSVCSDKDKMLVRSIQDKKSNISPKQGNNLLESFEGKRKSPSPRADSMPFSTMPRFIQSSGAVDIEIDISCPSADKISPTTSPISLLDYKIIKSVLDEKIDKDKSPKDVKLSMNVSRPGCSRDISPSAKDGTTSSSTVLAIKNSPIRDLMYSEKEHLSNEPSKGSSPTNLSSATLHSPSIKNLDSKTLEYFLTQLRYLIARREVCMRYIYNSLIEFKRHLEYMIAHIGNIIHIIQNIPILNEDYITEDPCEIISGLLRIASKFIKKLDSLKTDVQSDIDFWTKCFQQIHKIKKINEPLMSNTKPGVTIGDFYDYEERLKTKWDMLDGTITIIDSRRSVFLATADDLERCIKLFIKCLISGEILMPSSIHIQ